MLGLAVIFAGLLDTVSLASTMPFIALLVDIEAAMANRYVGAAFEWLGRPDRAMFVWSVGLASLALVNTAGLISWWLRRRTNYFVARCQSRLARDVMDALVHAPYSWFLGINAQTVAHVFQRDVLLWARDLVLKLLNMSRDIALIALPLLLVLAVTPLVGVVTLAVIAVIIVAVISFSRPRVSMLTEIKREADARAFSLAGQALAGIKDVVISGRQDKFVDSFVRAYSNYSWAQAALQNQHQLPLTAILLLGQTALLVVALVLWSAGSDRATLTAQLSLLVLVTSRIVPAANRLSSAVTTFFTVLPALRGIEVMLCEIREAGQSGRETLKGKPVHRPWRKIEFDKVGFTYPTTQQASLSGISIEIAAGRSYGIVGPSGAGKSTLSDLLMGFILPTTGTVRVDGQLMTELSLASWRSKIGYVPQSPFIADASLAANVAFGVPTNQVDRARLDRAIALASLDRLIAELPRGLDTDLGDRGLRLSGGQRQRVAIARAVYDDCDLLVLDEATSALDSMIERDIAEALHALAGRITMVIIAHRISTVAMCDEIFVLEGGRLVGRGKHAALMNESRQYRSLVAGQMQLPATVKKVVNDVVG